MSAKDSTPTGENTKPQDNNSPTTSEKSSAGKPVQEETIDEKADRIGNMIIQNLKNPANHPDSREYPKDK